ncbi:sensor histidine kinase [Streptomyces sp. NBC_01361]|uniref:sensor histidine kinase n=1 Tax=Streptomyces sp. NBC_01361 TaxID=2903838 RepID=UPI002E361768|nr:HAMP domain-containing sensor histidine kinase [Streptomyces sp. NBC_01361]
MIRRVRALPLRSRLALLVAVAVAVAVAAVSVTCWVIVQKKLYAEVDDQLHSSGKTLQAGEITGLLQNCSQRPSDRPSALRSTSYAQLVKADGTPCVLPNSRGTVEVTSSDKAVARDPNPGVETYRNGTDTDGQPVRVVTVPVVLEGPGQPVLAGNALLIALPLQDTQSTLNELALVLLLVSGIGVVGAGAAGLWIARSGLRPVDELTNTVEHVARTEDLTVRIPVEGDDEIARLSASFNSMTASLASSRDLQQQLIADAGHELRTPLTSMRTNIELLTRSDETGRAIPPDDRKALMASLKAQMTELAALIGDLQELSRTGLTAGDAPLKVVALHDTVRTALERAALRGPELKITSELAPWYVRAEPAALERAIVNLLDNAVKFSPPGATVEVRLMRGELTVRDHGPGIPAEELPHVFDRFWRSPTARALPGSGLGLSIVARTVQNYGGEVALAAAEGGGTVAVLRLPGAPTPPPDVDHSGHGGSADAGQ